MRCPHKGPLTRYVTLRVAHAPGMPGTFTPPPRVSDPDMHHGTCVTHVPWYMPGSLTSGFLWSRWRGKRSRHYRRMPNPQFYVSGKRPIRSILSVSCYHGYVENCTVSRYACTQDSLHEFTWKLLVSTSSIQAADSFVILMSFSISGKHYMCTNSLEMPLWALVIFTFEKIFIQITSKITHFPPLLFDT